MSRGNAGGTRRLPFGVVTTGAGALFVFEANAGAFLYVRIWTTPGILDAIEMSTSLIRARGCGQVRNLACNMFGNRTRLAYSAFPVNRGTDTSASGGSGCPITFRFSGAYP